MLGVCQCNDDFGGGDCSVDTNEPPPVYAVNYETGGLCDKLFCKEAIVDGDLFLDRSGLTCKMQQFEVSLLYFFNFRGEGVLNTCSINIHYTKKEIQPSDIEWHILLHLCMLHKCS